MADSPVPVGEEHAAQRSAPPRAQRLRQRLPPLREIALLWAELAGLCALAICDPIFEEIEQGFEVFPSLEVRGREVIAFVVAMVTIPPTLLLLLELLAGAAWTRARRFVHAGLVACLVASMVWQAAHGDGLAGSGFATFVLIASFAAVLAGYLLTRWLPLVTRVLALAAPFVALSFLLSSPARQVFGADDVPSPPIGNGAPVVLLVLDELPLATLIGPDGRIDRDLFPNFARLADQSTWYPSARTVADQTIHAVPAILSGQYPKKRSIPTRAQYPHNIFSLFGAGGTVSGYEVLTDLCGPSLCPDRDSIHGRAAALLRVGSEASVTLPFDIVQTVADWLPEHRTVVKPGTPGLFDAVIQSLRWLPTDRPSLTVSHQLVPHVPWVYLPTGQTYPDPGSLGVVSEGWSGADYYVKLGFQRHVLQTQFVDREIGRAIDALVQAGVWDKAVFAVVADHGAAFLPDFSRRGIGPVISGWVLPVPLFVKHPGQAHGKVDRRPARTIDVVPMLADAAEVEVPWKLDGRVPGAPRDPVLDDTYLSFQTGTARIPSRDVERALDEAIARRQRLLPGNTPFAPGGFAHLIGRRATSLNRPPLARKLDYEALADVYPDASLVSGFVSGTLVDFARKPSTPLAFALNGRIVATGEAFGKYGLPSFATVLPVSDLRRGRNGFEVYELPPRPATTERAARRAKRSAG